MRRIARGIGKFFRLWRYAQFLYWNFVQNADGGGVKKARGET
jgi:hypothetical protein